MKSFNCLSQILSFEFQPEINLSLQTPLLAPHPCQGGMGKVYARRGLQWASALPPRRQKPCRRVEGSALYHGRTKQTGRWSLSLEGGGLVPRVDGLALVPPTPFSLKRPGGAESSLDHRGTDFPVLRQAAARRS